MSHDELFTTIYDHTTQSNISTIVFRLSLAELLPINGTPMTATEIRNLYNEKTNSDITVQRVIGNLNQLRYAGIVERKEITRKIKKVYRMERTPNKVWIPVTDEVKMKHIPVYWRVK